MPDITPRCEHLPIFELSRVCDADSAGARQVVLLGKAGKRTYYREPVQAKGIRTTRFTKFPVVLCGDGSPWDVACLYLIDRAKLKPQAIGTLSSIARDLAQYRAFLEEFDFRWDDFSSAEPFGLPTYQYRAHLLHEIRAGRVSNSVASRRMANVISFYRHVQRRDRFAFRPAFSPWQEKSASISYRDAQGFEQALGITTTDISIASPKSSYAWEKTIDDGGKLRPLPQEEQEAVIAVLRELGNTEMSLIHESALLTGARAQTVLTFRLKHFSRPPSEITGDYKLRCGPGTGIDTKRQKADVYLTIPKLFYERLYIYAHSERARLRREKSKLKESPENYLFLTQHGKSFYESVDDRAADRDSDTLLRSAKIGQGLRKFIAERVVPAVRAKLNNPDFSYSFHDLRATFGMNFVDFFEKQMEMNREKRKWVMNQLRELMWHKSLATTERYVDYRRNMHMLKSAEDGWGSHLIHLLCVGASE
ncbi:integrase [Pelomonas sp. UHG3]|uniref:Integrase n=1 Tax=Roseateles hydrophilus TaxID=2975054 RepID=A0ACC6CDZ0_9BURK|nr:integrase [Pelomonas sp. UHG3]MCY4746561.1 integrase [Pelomonas sp. UHG3]